MNVISYICHSNVLINESLIMQLNFSHFVCAFFLLLIKNIFCLDLIYKAKPILATINFFFLVYLI